MKRHFFFGGVQGSYSFNCFHGDRIPTSLTATPCPAVCCYLVMLQNDPTSSGNVTFGGVRLGVVGGGIVLEPGDFSGVLPIQNLNQIWHKEDDATTYLNYYLICCYSPGFDESHAHILLEDGGHLLLEEGGRISL